MTVVPPDAGRQSRCVTDEEASQIIHGLYPLTHLEERLDHIDGCPVCTEKFRMIVVLVVARLDQLERAS